MNSKNRKTLEDIFKKPILSSIQWKDIEALLRALGAEIEEGSGSRIGLKLHNARAVFHRPHPRKETDKGSIASVKRFLEKAGIEL